MVNVFAEGKKHKKSIIKRLNLDRKWTMMVDVGQAGQRRDGDGMLRDGGRAEARVKISAHWDVPAAAFLSLTAVCRLSGLWNGKYCTFIGAIFTI